jgi:hypothetical protein
MRHMSTTQQDGLPNSLRQFRGKGNIVELGIFDIIFILIAFNSERQEEHIMPQPSEM